MERNREKHLSKNVRKMDIIAPCERFRKQIVRGTKQGIISGSQRGGTALIVDRKVERANAQPRCALTCNRLHSEATTDPLYTCYQSTSLESYRGSIIKSAYSVFPGIILIGITKGEFFWMGSHGPRTVVTVDILANESRFERSRAGKSRSLH